MLKKTTVKLRLSCLLAATSLIAMTSTNADSSKQFEFMVVEGYSSSEAVLDGNYQKAIELAKQRSIAGSYYDRAVNATSLCVAYAKMANLNAAVNACEKAVSASKQIGRKSRINDAAENNRKVVLSYASKSTKVN